MKQRKPGQIDKAEEQYLDRLQRESWNLELIISGLALFGLIALYGYYDKLAFLSKLTDGSMIGGFILTGAIIIYFCAGIVFVNLLIHLLLRGLWIGAVGLRSVSGDINFYQLRLGTRFNKFLRRRIGSFDQYIIKLDRVCSVIFSFSFLLVLLLIGFILYWVFFSLIAYLLGQVGQYFEGAVMEVAAATLMIVYVLLGFLYLIDFLTLGWLKRIRWLGKLYYPVYRFFGFVTLARIYRPLYYNFIDDTFGRKMVRLAIPYVIVLLTLFSASFNGGPFYDRGLFEDLRELDGKFTRDIYYENLRAPDEEIIPDFLLQTDLTVGPVNRLSLYVLPEYKEVITHLYPDATVLNDYVIASEVVAGFNAAGRKRNLEERGKVEYLNYFRQLFELRLNGRLLDMEDTVLFDDSELPFPKLVKYLSLNDERPGLQQLEITTFSYRSFGDSLRSKTVTLPFFYNPG